MLDNTVSDKREPIVIRKVCKVEVGICARPDFKQPIYDAETSKSITKLKIRTVQKTRTKVE